MLLVTMNLIVTGIRRQKKRLLVLFVASDNYGMQSRRATEFN